MSYFALLICLFSCNRIYAKKAKVSSIVSKLYSSFSLDAVDDALFKINPLPPPAIPLPPPPLPSQPPDNIAVSIWSAEVFRSHIDISCMLTVY